MTGADSAGSPRDQRATGALISSRWRSSACGRGSSASRPCSMCWGARNAATASSTSSAPTASRRPRATARRCCAPTVLRSGAYLSPHISGWSERVVVAGAPVGDDVFGACVERVRVAVGGLPSALGETTQFEVLTVAALLAFAECGAEAVALEAGLGGRLDATNVMTAPVVVLTNIGLEHTQVLGETREQIFAEKAAVIKGGEAVFGAARRPRGGGSPRSAPPPARGRTSWRAPAWHGDLPVAGDPATSFYGGLRAGRAGASAGRASPCRRRPSTRWQNAGLAVAAVRLLLGGLDEAAARRALAATPVPGRLQVVGERRSCWPTAPTTRTACASWRRASRPSRCRAPGRRARDHARQGLRGDARGACCPLLDRVVCTQASEPRSLAAGELAAALRAGGRPARRGRPRDVCATRTGVRRARRLAAPAGSVLVTGSLYLLEDLRDVLAGPAERAVPPRASARGLRIYWRKLVEGWMATEESEPGGPVPGRVPHRDRHRPSRLLRRLSHRYAPRRRVAVAGAVLSRRSAAAASPRQGGILTAPDARDPLILVTGATGYVGGRLVPRLLDAGHAGARASCATRRGCRDAPGRSRVDVATGDVLRPGRWERPWQGVDVAYYLVHCMARGAGFHERDLAAARAFGSAAAAAGVGRIIYLGGLGDPAADLSQHLRSRQETGDALREGGVPVTEFRAAVVVGAGSISFEMIRYLTERLPVMVCPRWVYTRVQPIAVDDLLAYLVAALDVPASAGRVIEIGGADVLTYGEMMLGYAKARGLCGGTCSRCRCSRRRSRRTGCTWSRRSRRRSRGRSSRGCATRWSCATHSARDLFPADPAGGLRDGRPAPPSRASRRGRWRRAGPTPWCTSGGDVRRACSPRRRA